MPWAGVGRVLGVSKITAWRVFHGHEPLNPKYRKALGLHPVFGPSTQYHDIRYCKDRKCRKPFIPNHPRRRWCFECRPPSKHRRK